MFIVKQYNKEEGPIIKGHGFDGLRVGENREEAEEFVAYINALLERSDNSEYKQCEDDKDKLLFMKTSG